MARKKQTEFSNIRVLLIEGRARQVMPLMESLNELGCHITTFNASKLDMGYASKYPSPTISLSSDSYLSVDEVSGLLKKYEPEYASAVRAIMPEGIEERRYMDYAMDYRLIHCLRNGLPLDMSVYDAAIWSCVIELSHKSIVAGSQPVFFPQF